MASKNTLKKLSQRLAAGDYHRLFSAGIALSNKVMTDHIVVPFLEHFTSKLDETIQIDGLTIALDHQSVTSAVKSYLLRGYESEERQLIDHHLSPDMNILEFGAGMGLVSCYANKRIGEGRRHLVVEPNPHLLDLIERNRDANDCSFDILHGAYSPTEEPIKLFINPHFLSSGTTDRRHASSNGETVEVPGLSVSKLVRMSGVDQFTLIADIEGAEYTLLEHERELLESSCRMMIIEFHETPTGGPPVIDAAVRTGRFEVADNSGTVFVLVNTGLMPA